MQKQEVAKQSQLWMHGSLRKWGVTYQEVPFTEEGLIDWDALSPAVTPSKLPSWHTDYCKLPQHAAAAKQGMLPL